MRSLIKTFLVGVAAMTQFGCDAIGAAAREDALRRFEVLCDQQAGLFVDNAVGHGGVRSTLSLGESLWLIYDFNAPFVEIEGVSTPSSTQLYSEWQPPSSGRWTLHAERVARGSPECVRFENWLTRIQNDELDPRFPARWKDIHAYDDQCLAIRFLSVSEVSAIDEEARASGQRRIRYRLDREIALHSFTGPWEVEEQRYSLVETTDRRMFTINALHAFMVRIDAPEVTLSSCGNPLDEDVSVEGRWFLDDTTPEGQLQSQAEGARLRALRERRLEP